MTPFAITLTAAQQRAIALGLALVVVVAVLASCSSFIAAQWAHHNRVTLLVRELSARRALVAQVPEWQERLDRFDASPQWQALLVTEPPAGQPGPVGQLVAKYGGSLSQSVVTPHDSGTGVELDEDVLFTADIAVLAHILYDIRSSGAVLVIRRLNIVDSEAAVQGPRTTPNKLRVDMTVAGFAAPR